jgi:competence protein ComEA
MDAPPPIPVPTPPPPPPVATTWPRSAQLATAFLLGVAGTLLVVHVLGALRWGSRPTDLERAPAYRIDLNRASRAELLQVPGIGPALVDRIDDYRKQNEFRSVDDLRQVHGIGPATLERVRPWLSVSADSVEPILERRSMSPPSTMEAGRSAAKKEPLTGPIDINRASAAELQRLSGIGPVLSQRIVDERGKRPFKTVDELRRVSGIGPKTLERLRPNITVTLEPPPLETIDEPR